MKIPLLMAAVGLLGAAAFAQSTTSEKVALQTNHGRIVIELDAEKAPATVASFLDNVDAGVYDGTIFHRVIPNFMVQGGGFNAELQLIPTDKSLRNEADNGLKNLRGTVAMARRGDPHSASIQFFINLVDNDFLDHTAKTPEGWGYAVFGRVVEGMEVADAIAAVPRGQVGPMGDLPNEAVVIEGARRLVVEEPAATTED
jgi:cyclophilin family peptidyl-prolyl cis-trans isomerase